MITDDRKEFLQCKDEYKKVDIIRDWTYENTLLAGTKELHKPVTAETLQEYIDRLVNNEIIDYGYYCGGIACILSEIYSYLGYNSCSMGTSICDENGDVVGAHATTLVYLDGKWLIEDATFNITYVDKDGKKLDIYTMQEKIADKESVDMEHGETLFRRCILPKSVLNVGIYETRDSFFIEQNTDIDVYFEANKDLLSPYIEKDGYLPEMAAFYMHPYAIYMPSNRKKNKSYDVKLFEELAEELGVSIDYIE